MGVVRERGPVADLRQSPDVPPGVRPRRSDPDHRHRPEKEMAGVSNALPATITTTTTAATATTTTSATTTTTTTTTTPTGTRTRRGQVVGNDLPAVLRVHRPPDVLPLRGTEAHGGELRRRGGGADGLFGRRGESRHRAVRHRGGVDLPGGYSEEEADRVSEPVDGGRGGVGEGQGVGEEALEVVSRLAAEGQGE